MHLISWCELHSAEGATVEADISGISVGEHLIGHRHSKRVMHRVLLKYIVMLCVCEYDWVQ